MTKTIMIIAGVLVVAFALFSVAEAAYVKLQKGEAIATVSAGDDMITVSRVVDGTITCYVAQHGKYGSQDISCVK